MVPTFLVGLVMLSQVVAWFCLVDVTPELHGLSDQNRLAGLHLRLSPNVPAFGTLLYSLFTHMHHTHKHTQATNKIQSCFSRIWFDGLVRLTLKCQSERVCEQEVSVYTSGLQWQPSIGRDPICLFALFHHLDEISLFQTE